MEPGSNLGEGEIFSAHFRLAQMPKHPPVELELYTFPGDFTLEKEIS
jgi:hypothetical protein